MHGTVFGEDSKSSATITQADVFLSRLFYSGGLYIASIGGVPTEQDLEHIHSKMDMKLHSALFGSPVNSELQYATALVVFPDMSPERRFPVHLKNKDFSSKIFGDFYAPSGFAEEYTETESLPQKPLSLGVPVLSLRRADLSDLDVLYEDNEARQKYLHDFGFMAAKRIDCLLEINLYALSAEQRKSIKDDLAPYRSELIKSKRAPLERAFGLGAFALD